MKNNINAYIKGVGYNVPKNIIKNSYFEEFMDTSDQWIKERTGIIERRFADEGQGPSDLAIPAVQMALDNSKLTTDDIDFIIFATSTPDYYIPGSGCLIQEKMNFKNIGALDIRCQCSGFIYALSIADQYIKTGMYENILVIGAEVQSTGMDLSNDGRNTAIIFADGAGAAIVSPTKEDKGILSTHLRSDGKYAKELWLEAPSSKVKPRLTESILSDKKQFLTMNGREVFRHAIKLFPEIILEALEYNNLKVDDIDLLIPHQANKRITQAIQKKMNLKDNQVISNIHKYGNTTAATIPIGLCEAVMENKLKKGDILVLAAFGSGFSWGSAILKW